MEFLSEYGLFVAKILTFLLAFVLITGFIAATVRSRGQESRTKLKVVHLNKKLKNIERQFKSMVLSHKEWKSMLKLDKKETKKLNKLQKRQKKKQDERKVAYVINFNGDMKASDVNSLTDTISLIIKVAKPKEEVVLRLESGGGYVHSYGLAAAQLLRLREHKLSLTVCVDKVAASGGYLMAAMADKICAAPFAILGSIGVVGMVPNINKLLKKGNIDVEYHTSGEYKRTLTMVGENTPKGRKKFQQDLQHTHSLFKDMVKKYRPSLSIAKVATGEIWYGSDALKMKLTDEIITSEEYLFLKTEKTDLYEVSVREKKNIAERFGKASDEAVGTFSDKLLSRMQEWNLFNR